MAQVTWQENVGSVGRIKMKVLTIFPKTLKFITKKKEKKQKKKSPQIEKQNKKKDIKLA